MTQSNTFDLNGLEIAALRFNAGQRIRALAVHGWLDNANSFAPLAAYLPEVDLVAIDLPGHGHSDHLGPGALYHFVDIQYWVFALAKELKWQQFHYIGHSLGGCIAPFIAVAQPELVSSITMIEATGPLTEEAHVLPQRLQRAAQDQITFANYQSRCFESIEQATNARLQASRMSPESARLIVERQLRKIADGYTWQFDQRHRIASASYLTEEQLLAVLRSVQCPTLCLSALDGYLTDRSHTQPRLSCIANLQHVQVPGNHHMHMDNPSSSAEKISAFFRHL